MIDIARASITRRFCRPCLGRYIIAKLGEELAANVRCPTCSVVVSVRDVQDFTRHALSRPEPTVCHLSLSVYRALGATTLFAESP